MNGAVYVSVRLEISTPEKVKISSDPRGEIGEKDRVYGFGKCMFFVGKKRKIMGREARN